MLMPPTSEPYRCNLDNVDWANSILVLGCSHTWGFGLEPEETYCYQLEKLLKKPVINLGMPGTGIDYTVNNLLRLNVSVLQPFKVIVQYSDSSRFFYWHDFDKITNYTPETVPSDIGRYLMSKPHSQQTAQFYRQIIHALCPDVVEFTFTIDDSIELNIPQAPVDDRCDRAKDSTHFGPLTNIEIAKWLSRLIHN